MNTDHNQVVFKNSLNLISFEKAFLSKFLTKLSGDEGMMQADSLSFGDVIISSCKRLLLLI